MAGPTANAVSALHYFPNRKPGSSVAVFSSDVAADKPTGMETVMGSSKDSKLAQAGERGKVMSRLATLALPARRGVAKGDRARGLSAAMLLVAGCAFAATAARADDSQGVFGPRFIVSCTIPANGDLNPYGVVFVPKDFPSGGTIAPGDVLVANFNNSSNLQGTGATIIKFTPSSGAVAPLVSPGQNGKATTFFTSARAGLTTALGVLRKGFVIVGNLPSTDGSFKTHGQGSLQVIDRNGNLVRTLTDAKFLNSPWDLTINDEGAHAQVFVSNAVTGTVARIDLNVAENDVAIMTQNEIADGYAHHGNAAAFVLAPTGLAFDKKANILYVASTLDNTIFSVTAAGLRTSPVDKGDVVFQDAHLRGPLALAFAPNGDLITANGDAGNPSATHPSEIVEFTTGGKFVGESNIDSGQGGAFGIAVGAAHYPFIFAAVDDVPNSVTVFNAPGVGLGSTAVAAEQ
jgi:hypothetical protein